ncbi:hypothetical protein ACJ5H2_13390 [Nocardioides sp. R1-1]|uniref:hypothetical protein n=1 Tax=Nocardioides sp. R1-1 TaxID=3383502 RepID=UPI0038D11A9D
MQLTLGQVAERLHGVHQDMAYAQLRLREARDAEVEAAATLRVARARAFLDPDCPKPKRGENGVTVADRDSWVDQRTHDEWLAAEVAEAHRKAAEDALRVSRDQASVVQSLAALMKAEMSLAGSGPGA